MSGWTNLHELIKMEIIQRTEEGCDTSGFEDKLNDAGDREDSLLELEAQLKALPVKPEFPFDEPSDLLNIRALCPDKSKQADGNLPKMNLCDAELLDRMKAAWLGRSIGCVLGKPLEHTPYVAGTDMHPGWKNIMLWFQGADAWPIQDYTPAHSRAEHEFGLSLNGSCAKSQRENLQFIESDDDLRYTVLGLLLLEEKGLNWDSWDVGKLWHSHLPFGFVCTAETQAYLNFAGLTNHGGQKPLDWQKQNEWVRSHLNPYREWIGAQIRVDAYAWAAAGNPRLAAELAWRDASFSHCKNGMYGAMFMASVIAAAFVEQDVEKLVEAGLNQIPATSRLAADIRKAVEIARHASNQVELVQNIWEEFKHYHFVHTNNNAALCAASLIFGKGDFEKTVTTSVLGGWDTDCNGATVGSIMGAMLGTKGIPEKWSNPLHDTLYSEIPGFHPISLTECAERTFKVYQKIKSDIYS